MTPAHHPLFEICQEQLHDHPAINSLHEAVFGPGRFARTAFRVREACDADPRFCLTAWHAGGLIGSVRLTPIRIGDRSAFLLGPLCVRPEWQGLGVGKGLVRQVCEDVGRLNPRPVILVGDRPYYGPLGFETIAKGVIMPGPVDPGRLLIAWPGGLTQADCRGVVRAAPEDL
ncbi:MAG: N-acetyltransferase [Pseudomonadota bacterium]